MAIWMTPLWGSVITVWQKFVQVDAPYLGIDRAQEAGELLLSAIRRS